MAFFAVFLALFLTAGLGSGSTFQMISVIFRKLTMDRVKAEGGSDERAMREAATDTAGGAGFHLCDWRDWWLLYPESVW
ncbi:nitrite extrusion protein 1 [Escherichia coli]|uniref:Nitrite extrusion protein 1 n=1 Tax=Escherichia coli TaxID=562 RepID=A0A376RJI0_ECOLX|nr:nitrite extrusion protein 1 [Escherichia coli]